MQNFVKIKSSRNGGICHLLMKVNHVIVANFYVANMSLNAIREIKFSRKFPNLQYFGEYPQNI